MINDNPKPRPVSEHSGMSLLEAVRVARQALAEHYRLHLHIMPNGKGEMTGHIEGAEAYNTLADYHSRIAELDKSHG